MHFSALPAPSSRPANAAKTHVALAALSVADAQELLGRVKRANRGLGSAPLAAALAHLEQAQAALACWEGEQAQRVVQRGNAA